MDNYFLGGSTGVRQPTQVPSTAAASPRLPNQPGQAIPAGQSPFPSSGQKPGNREGNQRIPYARFQFTWPDDTARPREMQTGDVVFVHKTSQAMGHGHGRNVKATGLPQLNRMLAKHGVLDFADAATRQRVKEARVAHYEALRKAAEYDKRPDLVAKYTRELESAEKLEPTAAVAPEPTAATFEKGVDWAAVKTLTEWTLDGVLISVDDEVDIVRAVEEPRWAHDHGILLNVAVAGPTPMRNTVWEAENSREPHEYDTQHVDNNIPVLDNVFVGLFFKRIFEKDVLKTQRFSFEYKLFSGRKLHSKRNLADGPTEINFEELAGAWRVGTVMDTRLTKTVERMMTVNVCAEWLTTFEDKLEKKYGDPDVDEKKQAEAALERLQRETVLGRERYANSDFLTTTLANAESLL